MRRIFLVRHGQPHNPQDMAYGFLPRVRLTDEGVRQARRAGAYLRQYAPVACYTSPLLRAAQTARALVAELASGTSGPVPLHFSWLLRESELARLWQGTPWAAMPERFPLEYHTFMNTPALSISGETLAAQAERVRRLMYQADRRQRDGSLVFVSHRDPIVALRLMLEGRSLNELHETSCGFCSIHSFSLSEHGILFDSYVEV